VTTPTETVSYSKISLYQQCAEKYRLKYLAKEEAKEYSEKYICLEEPLIKGSLAHSIIEYFLGGMDKEDAIAIGLTNWVRDICLIEAIEGEPEGDEGVNIHWLEQYAKGCGGLMMRCSEGYNGEDKIRKKDGGIYSDPMHPTYGSKTFKSEYRALNLDQYKSYVDNQACRANNSFKRMSLSDIAAEATSFAYLFELPEVVTKVNTIEYNLAEQPVLFNDGKSYWNGLLDTEYETAEQAIIINDHKTEKEKRNPEDVAFDLQLNSYASVRYEQTGKLADYIAITHLKSNEVIASATSPAIVSQCMDYLQEVQDEINLQIEVKGTDKQWLRKWPGKYGSPCFRRNWKTKALDSCCPYLKKCHPHYYECIKDEVDDFFGVNG